MGESRTKDWLLPLQCGTGTRRNASFESGRADRKKEWGQGEREIRRREERKRASWEWRGGCDAMREKEREVEKETQVKKKETPTTTRPRTRTQINPGSEATAVKKAADRSRDGRTENTWMGGVRAGRGGEKRVKGAHRQRLRGSVHRCTLSHRLLWFACVHALFSLVLRSLTGPAFGFGCIFCTPLGHLLYLPRDDLGTRQSGLNPALANGRPSHGHTRSAKVRQGQGLERWKGMRATLTPRTSSSLPLPSSLLPCSLSSFFFLLSSSPSFPLIAHSHSLTFTSLPSPTPVYSSPLSLYLTVLEFNPA